MAAEPNRHEDAGAGVARATSRFFNRDRAEFDRGLGFFDAVYAFAITLLIVNIDLPPASAWSNLASIFDHGFGSQLLGFLISFAVIALFWLNNFEMFSRVTALTKPILTANFVATLLIVFIPFTTQGMSDPAFAQLPLPTATYALNVALAILAQTLVFEVARVQGMLAEEEAAVARWPERLDVAGRVLVFLLSIPIAYLFGPTWAQLSWLLLIVVAPITGRWVKRAGRPD